MIDLSNAKLDSHLESEGFQILEVNTSDVSSNSTGPYIFFYFQF